MRCEKCQEGRGGGRRLGGCARWWPRSLLPDKVGQNPWSDDMSEFQRHLSELREDSMYKALLAGQKAQELDPEVAVHEK